MSEQNSQSNSQTPRYALLPQYTTTGKSGRPRTSIREPEKLLSLAIERGGTVTLDAQTSETLRSHGLPPHRVTNAAYGLRKFYGLDVTPIRNGRKVTGYTIKL